MRTRTKNEFADFVGAAKQIAGEPMPPTARRRDGLPQTA